MSDFTDEAVAPLESAVLGAVMADSTRWGERFRAHIDLDQFETVPNFVFRHRRRVRENRLTACTRKTRGVG